MVGAVQYFFDALLGREVKKNGRMNVADVGCGTGALFSYLKGFGKVAGLDRSPLALSYALKLSRDNGVELLQSKANELPLKEGVLDMVCLSDVLYHRGVADDNHVLNECFRVLRPGGLLILSDSAFKILKSEHDSAAHAARRYSASDIRSKLEKNGFFVKRLSYTYMSLFPITMAVRFLKNTLPRKEKSARVDFNLLPRFFNLVVKTVFFCEAQVLRLINFPFGISVMAVGVKR